MKGMIEGFFGDLKFSISGFFWVGKFGKYFFGWLDLSRDFFWVLKILKFVVVPWLHKEVLLGASSVVKMITPDEGKINSDGMMNKQTQAFNFVCF